jgi:very-short-patch-repair endonuclease
MASDLERRFADAWLRQYPQLPYITEQTIPSWEAWAGQRKLLGLCRVRRPYRGDFLWPDSRVIVECQGGTWAVGGHSSGAGIDRDAAKAITAQLGGWLLLPITTTMLRNQAGVWLPMIAEAIMARHTKAPM